MNITIADHGFIVTRFPIFGRVPKLNRHHRRMIQSVKFWNKVKARTL